MPTVRLDHTPIEYVEHGAGEPVVFVHGSLGDIRSWEPQIGRFASEHRVVAYSRRYHHPNACHGDEADYSARLHADDLAELVARLDLGPTHLVGSSYGAFTALMTALRHPNVVRSLVLSEPPALPLLADHPEGEHVRDSFIAAVWEPAGQKLRQGEMEDGVRTFVDGLFGDGAFDQLPDPVHDLLMDNACEFRAETSSAEFWTPITRDDVKEVSAPTLLFSGGKSPRMLQLVVEVLDECLPNAEHVRIAESSHDLPGEVPERFNELVLRFLAAHEE
jgi:pimeloyl-ACP methyl ester carboxylesterase